MKKWKTALISTCLTISIIVSTVVYQDHELQQDKKKLSALARTYTGRSLPIEALRNELLAKGLQLQSLQGVGSEFEVIAYYKHQYWAFPWPKELYLSFWCRNNECYEPKVRQSARWL